MNDGGPWHWWFAWRPVRLVDGRWVWLRRVMRRLWYFPDGLPGAPGPFWEYHSHHGYVRGQRGHDSPRQRSTAR
jgi:hypothetical protein